MLVWLAEYLTQYFSVFNVFSYLTFRAILGILTSLLLSLYLGPKLIARLQKMQIGQVVRGDGPESHFSKKGTPTMGGLLILGSVLASTLLWADLDNKYVWVVLFVLVSFGWIGFVDDYRKVIRKDPKGLIARWKYFWQSVFAIATAFFLYATAERPAETSLVVPFLKDVLPQQTPAPLCLSKGGRPASLLACQQAQASPDNDPDRRQNHGSFVLVQIL